MSIRFIPVSELKDPLTVTLGLSGASGTGKTYSALRVARGIAETVAGKGAPIGVVDTENRRALHYRDAFPEMVHYDMKAVDDAGRMVGFGPERWIEVIDAAEAAGLPVVVIDSFSHAWEGVGGVLDLHAQTLDRLTRGDESKKAARSQLAWAEVKPRYRRLIDRIVRARTNIIVCTRAKPVMQDPKTGANARQTKTRRADVPWDPAADGDLMFEMTAMVILDPEHPGCPVYRIKCADQFKGLFDPRRPLDEEIGRRMASWAQGQGSGEEAKKVMDAAREIARGGKKAFLTWWAGEGMEHRDTLRPIINELRRLAEAADADRGAEDDPFATPAPSTAVAQDDAPSLLAEIGAALSRGAAPQAVRRHFAVAIESAPPDDRRKIEEMLNAGKAA